MNVEIRKCPHCLVTVGFQADGKCPACGKHPADPVDPDQKPAMTYEEDVTKEDPLTTLGSWFSAGLAGVLFFLTIGIWYLPEEAKRNENFREGVRKALGSPANEYDPIAAATIMFCTPAVLLLVRAFFAPRVPQFVSTAFGSYCIGLVAASIPYGRRDSILVSFAAIALACVLFDLWYRRRVHEYLRMTAWRRHHPKIF